MTIGTSVVAIVRTSRLASWTRGLAAAVVASLGAPALAQPTPAQVAQQAIENIVQVTQNTTARLEAGAQRAVENIEELDKNMAPDPVIIAAGHRAIHALQAQGQGGRERIQSITRRAVTALNRLNAPPALIESVQHAAQTGRQAITQAQNRAVSAVREAVEEAIGPG